MKKKNTLGEKFVFQEVKWLRYTKEEKKTIFYKTSLKEDAIFKRLDLSRTKNMNETMNDVILPIAYNDTLPITNEKKNTY